MLPPPHRLPTPQVAEVLHRGKRVHSQLMTILYERQRVNGVNASEVSRFAFVVGVKVSKKAVERNRVKRLLRESVHHLLPQVSPGLDVVIVAKKELVGVEQQQIETHVKNLFLQAGLLSNEL